VQNADVLEVFRDGLTREAQRRDVTGAEGLTRDRGRFAAPLRPYASTKKRTEQKKPHSDH
jgi:hypothetical protein